MTLDELVTMRDSRAPRGDEPRKVVVCHPNIYPEVQAAVMSLGHGDVLVQPNRWVPDAEQVYVIDPKAIASMT